MKITTSFAIKVDVGVSVGVSDSPEQELMCAAYKYSHKTLSLVTSSEVLRSAYANGSSESSNGGAPCLMVGIDSGAPGLQRTTLPYKTDIFYMQM